MTQLQRLLAEEHYTALLSSLTPKQLAVISLCLYDDLDYADAATILGISRRAAMDRILTARRRLLRRHPDLKRSLKP